jgi:uncharacterized membrane protein
MEKITNWLFRPNVLATAKTITYRIVSSATTFIMMYIFTNGNVKESGQATLIFILYKPVLFWIHDRIWLVWERRRKIQTT